MPRQAIAGVKLPRLYLACGTDDTLAWEPNVRFRALLEEYHVPYEWEQTRGVHEWRLWDIFIQRFLDRLPIEGNYSAII